MERQLKRAVVLTVGWVLIGVGIIGLVVPILQGVLFILLGLYVLSRESRWARGHFERLRARFPGLEKQIAAWKARMPFSHGKKM